MSFKTISFSVLILTLISCGGGGEGKAPSVNTVITPPVVVEPTPTLYKGTFFDAAVENLNYKTAMQEGVTSSTGEFNYQLDETIVFSIGDIVFPEVLAAMTLTPLDIFNTEDINNVAVVNMLRLLQSLDIDGDATNGISISDNTHELAAGLIVDFQSNEFDSQVALLVENSGALNQELITAQEATYHFQQTLDAINEGMTNDCTSTHSKVGQTGFFETYAHNVSGKAEIINDCTIKITQFYYDGGGPDVYFYGAENHEYSGISAFALGQQLNGQVYENAEITIRLPTNKTLDDITGLSVWCVDVNANFGQLTFAP